MAELAHPGPNFAGEHKPLSEKISIHNLDFFYGKSQALKNINLTLYHQTSEAASADPSTSNIAASSTPYAFPRPTAQRGLLPPLRV